MHGGYDGDLALDDVHIFTLGMDKLYITLREINKIDLLPSFDKTNSFCWSNHTQYKIGKICWLIDWLVFNANFINISAILWHEQNLYIKLHNYKTFRNKTYLCIKQLKYFKSWE